MIGGIYFSRILRHFSHSDRMDVSAHYSALDDEEFFVVEGSGWRGRRESDSQAFCGASTGATCRNCGSPAVAVHRLSSTFPFVPQRQFSNGPDYSADHRDSAVAARFQVVDVPVMRVVQFLRCKL